MRRWPSSPQIPCSSAARGARRNQCGTGELLSRSLRGTRRTCGQAPCAMRLTSSIPGSCPFGRRVGWKRSCPDARALHVAVLKAKGPHQANRMLADLSRRLHPRDGESMAGRQSIPAGEEGELQIAHAHPQRGRNHAPVSDARSACHQQAADAIRLCCSPRPSQRGAACAVVPIQSGRQGLGEAQRAHEAEEMHRVALGRKALAILRRMREHDPEGKYLFAMQGSDEPRYDLKRPGTGCETKRNCLTCAFTTCAERWRPTWRWAGIRQQSSDRPLGIRRQRRLRDTCRLRWKRSRLRWKRRAVCSRRSVRNRDCFRMVRKNLSTLNVILSERV